MSFELRSFGLPLFVMTMLAACGCRPERTQAQECAQDSDCGSPATAWLCDNGTCACRTNDACKANEFCNSAGFCQARTGCEENKDCLDPGLFCDTTTGTCLSKGRCTSDLHCELGKVCDLKKSTCVDGCRTSGDCPGSSCRCGEKACACTGTTQAELATCEIGVCDPGFCADESFCQFGELCGAQPDAGTPLTQCYSDFDPDRRPYCSNCTFGGGTQVCGSGPNYCLIDTANPGNYYCGADCSQGQACPRGYACQDVIVVLSQWQCQRDSDCPTNPALACKEDKDCKRGGSCVKGAGAQTGFCAGKCGIDEGDTIGYCSCQVDTDCSPETCTAGECSTTRRKCTVDEDCKSIRCVDFQGAGGCLIGQNCAPANGLSCVQVR